MRSIQKPKPSWRRALVLSGGVETAWEEVSWKQQRRAL